MLDRTKRWLGRVVITLVLVAVGSVTGGYIGSLLAKRELIQELTDAACAEAGDNTAITRKCPATVVGHVNAEKSVRTLTIGRTKVSINY